MCIWLKFAALLINGQNHKNVKFRKRFWDSSRTLAVWPSLVSQDVFISFLFLNTMTKATDRRKGLCGLWFWRIGAHGGGAWQPHQKLRPHISNRTHGAEGGLNDTGLWNVTAGNCDVLPARQHLLGIFKQYQTLGTKLSNIGACGGHSHSNQHIFLLFWLP